MSFDLLHPAAAVPDRWAAAPDPAGTSRSDASLLARALDMIDYGIVLLHDDGRVAFVNQSARRELGDAHALRLGPTRLEARHAGDAAALQEAVDGAIRKGAQRLVEMGRSAGRPTRVSVLPVDGPAAGGPRGALVVLEKRSVCVELSAQAYARHHSITRSELEVLQMLCAGHEAAEIASLRGVALSTVRTQIATLRDKTDTASIGELVRQVARLPPMMQRLQAAAA